MPQSLNRQRKARKNTTAKRKALPEHLKNVVLERPLKGDDLDALHRSVTALLKRLSTKELINLDALLSLALDLRSKRKITAESIQTYCAPMREPPMNLSDAEIEALFLKRQAEIDAGMEQFGAPFIFKLQEEIGAHWLRTYRKQDIPLLNEIRIEAHDYKTLRRATEVAIEAHNRWVEVKNATSSAQLNKPASPLTSDLLSEAKEGNTMRSSTPVRRPRRDRSGYVQKNRLGKVSLQVLVEPEIHSQFKKIADGVGVPVNELMRHLVQTTIAHGTAPAVEAAISAERERAETARANLLATITPSKVTPS